LFGRQVDADEFVGAVVDEVANEHVCDFNGRFSLHGHSAGAQFAARYLVAHPERLDAVVSACRRPIRFPIPPGRGRKEWRQSSGTTSADRWQTERRRIGYREPFSSRVPRAGWRQPARFRSASWSVRVTPIRFVLAEGLDHDETAMAVPAQKLFAGQWAVGR
jgi:pimeloyl-ACP methyl ester carboxylesterase